MSTNKKVLNATPMEFDGITFKSKLEVMAYKTLKEAGLAPLYEHDKIVLMEGFKPTAEYYVRDKQKVLVNNSKKLINITYTPDFTIEGNHTTYFLELKGRQNDTFPLKKKLFRKYMESCGYSCIYFELYTKREVLQAIDIINRYEGNTNSNKNTSS